DAIIRLMQLVTDPGPINIGNDYDIRISEVAKRIVELTGSTSQIVYDEASAVASTQGLPDLTKAREELGWMPIVTFEQGLKRTIEYTTANRGLVHTMDHPDHGK